MDRNEKFKQLTEEEREIMATASFNKEFVVSNRKTAARVIKSLNSSVSTIKTSPVDVRKDLDRSEILLKKLFSR